MNVVAAYISAILLAGLAVFQAALAVGVPWGRFAWGGQHGRLPVVLRVGSLAAILIYIGLLAIQMQKAHVLQLLPIGDWIDAAAWAVVVFYLLGIVGNAASRSVSERWVMTPLVSMLFILSLVIALGA
ncbi:hypothetical protein PSC71_09580 [Devosia sp. J2-20]|uniref:hypothetical protein n=1 Tax=Devosia sp. J2-20 TaxID=3026161 RepID=UPI00249C9C26|nr:hypothetical protein [Devosia sp. J2-20]WDR00964.1 hypothetical protein PSC71_09580 [Devosia sp. J2-20]